MTVKKNFNRQELLVAYVELGFADAANGVDSAAIDMPPNSVIFAGDSTTTEAWNSGTSDVIDVGDAASQNRYLNDASAAVAAKVSLVPTGYTHPGGPLTLKWTGVGAAPTAGKTRVTVLYYILGRGEVTYG